MLIGILGDVHANLEALDAVLKVGDRVGVNRWVQLGDVVGYGPDPSECIARLRERDVTVVAGNHDWACCGRIDPSGFHHAAREAALWTRALLSDEENRWLSELPMTAEDPAGLLLFHGTWVEPEAFHYLVSPELACLQLHEMPARIGCCGHTHVPSIYVLNEGLSHSNRRVADLKGAQGAVLNPGSVGQPRDGDPRAAFAIWSPDQELWTLYRCEYEIAKTQAKLRSAGLPETLALRLATGH